MENAANLPIIEIKNLGKRYNITHQKGGYIALRDVVANIVKSPFSFLKTKTKKIAGMETKEEFWALKDVNLEIRKGEIIGIIGSNGAGKSTLLKILSQITPPTTGEVKIRGSVGSLLEVGTGFHPELTGRENIFLNGAILGMPRKNIAEKFDDIVEFAGISKFLDTPVKYYSSGMYVRLAFSVAAHIEPDILIVDEVLAVGDAEFQKKCLGKMDEITKKDGRTILFVSHNISAVQSLCTRAILLRNGKIVESGDTKKVIESYMNSPRASNLDRVSLKDRRKRTNGDVVFQEVKGMKNGKECWDFDFDEDIMFEFKAVAEKDAENLLFYMVLRNPLTREVLTNIKIVVSESKIIKGQKINFSISIPKHTIRTGQYSLYFTLSDDKTRNFYDVIDENINIPLLNVSASSTDSYENVGFISIPFALKLHD